MAKLAEQHIAVLILAAGRGHRMGAEPKLLLPLHDGRPVIWHTVRNAEALKPADLVVVVRPDLPDVYEAIRGLQARFVINALYMDGISTSLAVGIEALMGEIEAAMIMLGDEPAVAPRIVERLVLAYGKRRMPITIPFYGDEPGPPTLCAREAFPELLALTGDTGVSKLVTTHPQMVCRVPFTEDERPRDVDTPEDYRALLRGGYLSGKLNK
ncbi:MAG: nucleotidyltransferase family protein [Chloroflexi bacterium]|nr:nucleotidyltransferase family protein [Chloroflexota bacterium]